MWTLSIPTVLRILAALALLRAPVEASARAEERIDIVSVTLNGHALGDALLTVHRDETRLEARLLARAGLRWPLAAERFVTGDTLVAIDEVPGLTWQLDTLTGALDLRAPASAFRSTHLSMAPPRQPASDALTSVVANYAVTGRADGMAVSSEITGQVGGLLLQTSVSLRGGEPVRRGLTSVTFDDRDRLVRWQVGESLQRGVTGSAHRVLGVSVSRAFEMDPTYAWQTPTSLAGALDAPATAEIYVNGQLVSRAALPAGAFALEDIPASIGLGDVRVVLRDAFGRQQDLTQRFYRGPSLLRPGTHQFRYQVGVDPRQSSGLGGRTYVLAEHRVGLTRALTVGATATGMDTQWRGGPIVAVQSPLGGLELGALVDAGAGAARYGGSAAYDYRSRWLSLRLSLAPSERSWALGPARYDLVTGVGAAPWRGTSVFAGLTRVHDWRGARQTRASVGTSLSWWRRSSLQVQASRVQSAGEPGAFGIGVTWGLAFGNRSSASIGWSASDGVAGPMIATVQTPMPTGPGVGYMAQWAGDGQREAITRTMLSAQHPLLRADVQHLRVGGRDTWDANVSGAVVVAGGGVFLTRPIPDAWALVEIPSGSGVQASASNQQVGRTNRGGRLLVPSLTSYTPQRLSVDAEDLPIGAVLGAYDATVVPRLRAGVRVRFAAVALRAWSGRLLLPATWASLGATARLERGGGTVMARSPVGHGGEVYFEFDGGDPVRVVVESALAVATCDLPERRAVGDATLTDIGDLTCRETVTTLVNAR